MTLPTWREVYRFVVEGLIAILCYELGAGVADEIRIRLKNRKKR